MKIILKKDYAEERRKMYQDVGEQLDALYEMARFLKNQGYEFPEKVNAWIEYVNSVKESIKKV